MTGTAEILTAIRELSNLKGLDRTELHGLLQDGIHAALAKKHGANVQAEDGSDKGFYALSLADPATAKAALEGDPSALARAKEMCPLFAGGYNIDRRWVVLFHQIGIESRGRVAKQSLVLPWAFGKDKYSKLTEIYNSLKAADGRQIPLSAIELNILCTDTNFQKVDITPILQKHQFMCSYADSLAACANELYDPKNPDAGSPLLDDFLKRHGA